MRKVFKHKLLIGCLVAIVLLFSILTPIVVNAATPNVATSITRIGGFDQYATAALMAQKGWTGATDNVVLSAGMNYNLVDALAAGPLAAKLKAPILLTDGSQGLNSFAKAELQRLKPKKVYITSGTAVIKSSVIDEIKLMGITAVSLGGYDQYETSVNIAEEMIALGANVTKVVVAAGWVAPVDALSVSSIAATQEIPILATTQDRLPPSVQDFLYKLNGITDSYVIGGTAVVGNTIVGTLPGTVHRYCGVTKFDTNLEVLKGFADKVHYEKVYVANGETFVDALSGVPLAALTHSPIILSQSEWSNAMTDFLKLKNLHNVVALGGVVAVPDEEPQQLTYIINASSNPPVIPSVTPSVTPPVTPSDTIAPEVYSASATIGGSTVNAVKQTDGSWQVDLSTQADSALFTDMNIVADLDATEATMSITITGGTTIKKTIQFSNGIANVNIYKLVGVMDAGKPGLSLATLRTLGVTSFMAELKDAAKNKKTVTIHLNLGDL